MEAEINALAGCMRELIPAVDLVKEVGDAVGLEQREAPKVRVHKDNDGAFILANTLPPQYTPRSKFYALKMHWFRQECFSRGIIIQKIATTEQLGDILTKCLPQATFEYLRKKLMGW